ncbi:isoprenyl transferase [Endozoicomonas sp. Mp262]|uniref:isoprenyl transferase n=1 Tax=Endozoicomonas sp. Mp262 TaxID=2919499 RepID=UPI0021D90A4E
MTASFPSQPAPAEPVPKHIAVIMDGNNRWAKSRLLPKLSGHKAATNAVRATIRASKELGVNYLTLFAFSSENWNRPRDEVRGLMSLLLTSLKKEAKKLVKYDIRLKVIGERNRLSPVIQAAIDETESVTAHCQSMTLCVAINYGGQWDIAQACKKLATMVKTGEIAVNAIDEQQIERQLATRDIPPVDLLIRTSGEQRISNFLLWQCAYSEFYFTDTLWPDFGKADLERAIQAYQNRERRFGKTSEQLVLGNRE